MVAANEVPETVVVDGTVGALHTCKWAKEGHTGLSIEERRKVLFEKLELSGLKSWIEENKEKVLNLLAEYHDIFVLEDGKMGCTAAAEHKIKLSLLGHTPFDETLCPRYLIFSLKNSHFKNICLKQMPQS